MSIGAFLRKFTFEQHDSGKKLRAIRERWRELAALPDDRLGTAAKNARGEAGVVEVFALTAEIARRTLSLEMFDEQILGALAMERGHIAEMRTGEGKTLAAVPAIVRYALQGRGVHVLTANDYLARRDAAWMSGIYGWFGLSVAHVGQEMTGGERRAAYLADITYATANEVGFDYLRDGLARTTDELVHRPFAFALIDEADSILIDEARIPLVIAGGAVRGDSLPLRADAIVRGLVPHIDYTLDEFARNVTLMDAGIARVERAFGCGNLFEEGNLRLLTAIQDALHAHALLRRDVDYVVRNGAAELVDEFRGRIAENRRWPAGLQTAVEAKEGLCLKDQGRILGSITVQSLVALYQRVCGMTGTAATQAREFRSMYKLDVTVIPTHRPVIREDLPDLVFPGKEARDRALAEEIQEVHATGRPMLIGTASVEESERLSRGLAQARVKHVVLNARNNEAEAAIVAQAGAPGAVTISTNMAGRGTDIVLGGNPPRDREKVLALGGLYVIGTTRHEAARIDNQLRGRAGRQGDPGTSRFFVSLEDDLLVRFGVSENPDVDSVQRTAESQGLEIRETLWKYDSVIERHRREVHALRREVLEAAGWTVAAMLPPEQYAGLVEAAGAGATETAGREIVLALLDELWADYLANVAELRGGVHWVAWGGRDPLYRFLTGVEEIYADFHSSLRTAAAEAFSTAEVRDGAFHFRESERFERGATWTYLTTDQPFGTLGERFFKGLRRKLAGG